MGNSEFDKELAALRERIDAVDRELLALVNRRARLAQEVGALKEHHGQDDCYYRPDREADILRSLLEHSDGPLPDEALATLFREVISACRSLEGRMRIVYLGPEGTFTEAAAIKQFGQLVVRIPMESIAAVFREVESDACEYGVVPVENSTEGVVNHTLDMFLQSRLCICGEVDLRIHQNLLAVEGTERSAITRVYSHQQSLAQCRKWLDTHLPGAERITVSSNAEAARRASAEAGTGAVAGEMAARRYALCMLARNIEDESDNTTRFLVIGRRPVDPSASDKTSLLLSARNQPGALFRLLEPFAKRGITMTRIESRPSRSGLWEYVFFVDIAGHLAEPNVRAAVDEIEGDAALCRVLGSYPRAVS